METKLSHIRITNLANLLQSCIDKKSHLQGRITHAHLFRNRLLPDIFLSNKLIEFYSKCASLDHARYVFSEMPATNVYSWNAIVGAHVKASHFEDAYDLFVRMPERNTVSWNTVISSFARSGFELKALNLYHMMLREGFGPTHFTFASVLSACASVVDMEHGRSCHGFVIKVGLDRNLYVENALVGMYAKCGCIEEAILVFDEIAHPNEVSCTSLMGGLSQTDRVEDALRMFGKMHRNSIQIDAVALSSILGVCARCENSKANAFDENNRLLGKTYGHQMHALVVRLGFVSDLHVANSLMDMYAKFGEMDRAEMVFEALPEVNTVSWNVLIAGYGQKGNGEKAVELLKRMHQLGFKPDEVTYVGMLGACIKWGDLETAHEMFCKMSNPSVTSWNTVISGHCQKENHIVVVELFREMQFGNVRPDRTTIAVVLSSCAGLALIKGGKEVHAASVKAMLHYDVYVASGLVDMYAKCGNIDSARCIFETMKERDVVAWNSIISGFALHSLHKEAFSFFKQMREEGMHPTQFSYASVVSSCTRLASLSQGRQIHAVIMKDGYANDVYVGSTLIDMYAKCGAVEEARQFFDGMPHKNVVSWNEMIHGYAQNGLGEKAVELFEDMLRTEEKPDGITFIAVLTACSHSELSNEGMRYLSSMEKEYGIVPKVDHYTCIIDSLGRAGRFKEAKALVDIMPYKDDPIVWEVLLSACRLHANDRLGKWAAEHLFHLDPQNSAPYVLLSNIYAALGKWDDVTAVRKLMGVRGVVKDPGYSWMESKNGVQAFMVDDDLTSTRNYKDGTTFR